MLPAPNQDGSIVVGVLVDYGFSWHYDFEDVFIAQTDGAKEYFFRENTVDLQTRGGQPDFTRVRDEVTPIASSSATSRARQQIKVAA